MTDRVPGIDAKLLEILRAPGTHASLRYDPDHNELVDDQAGLAYPIRDGIPIMLPDEARQVGGDKA